MLWDYGGRAMVQSYPVLLFPLASLMQFIAHKKIRIFFAAPVLLLFTYFNLWWTWQAHKGTLIGSVPATSSYYWATILRYNLPLEIQKLRDNKDLFTSGIKHPVLLYSNAFDSLNDKGNIEIADNKQDSFSFSKPRKTING